MRVLILLLLAFILREGFNYLTDVDVKKEEPVPVMQETTSPANAVIKPFTLASDKTDYKIGEPMVIKFSVNEPLYVRIVVINSKGEINTLFPNEFQKNNFLEPGKNYQVPPTTGEFAMAAQGPAGTDKIRAIASKDPIPENSMFFSKMGYFDEDKMTKFPIRASFDYNIH